MVNLKEQNDLLQAAIHNWINPGIILTQKFLISMQAKLSCLDRFGIIYFHLFLPQNQYYQDYAHSILKIFFKKVNTKIEVMK